MIVAYKIEIEKVIKYKKLKNLIIAIKFLIHLN